MVANTIKQINRRSYTADEEMGSTILMQIGGPQRIAIKLSHAELILIWVVALMIIFMGFGLFYGY